MAPRLKTLAGRFRGSSSRAPRDDDDSSSSATPPPPPPRRGPRLDAYHFISLERQDDWRKFVGKNVESERYVVFQDLAAFHTGQIIDDAGLRPLFTLDVPVYPEMVRYFFCNLTGSHYNNGTGYRISTRVKGMDLSFNVENFGAILGIPTGGERIYVEPRTDSTFFMDEATRLEVYRTLLGDEILAEDMRAIILEKRLRPSARLVSRLVQFNILPRAGHRNEVGLLQAFVTYYLVMRMPLCVPYLIMRNMALRASRPDEGSLGYGMIVTCLMLAGGVDLMGEGVGGRTQRFNRTSLRRMELEDADASDDEIPAEYVIHGEVPGEVPVEEMQQGGVPDVPMEDVGVQPQAEGQDGGAYEDPYADIDFSRTGFEGYQEVPPPQGDSHTYYVPQPDSASTRSYFESLERLLTQRFDDMSIRVDDLRGDLTRSIDGLRGDVDRHYREVSGHLQSLDERVGRVETYFEGRVPVIPPPTHSGTSGGTPPSRGGAEKTYQRQGHH